jgi:hypothetical protein
VNIPGKNLLAFVVPRVPSKYATKIDLFQSAYEQMICSAFNTIDHNGIVSLAMPLLEPTGKMPMPSFVTHRQVRLCRVDVI